MNTKVVYGLLSFAVSVVVVYYVLVYIADIASLASALAQISWEFFVIAMLVYLIENLIVSERLRRVFHNIRLNRAYSSCFWGNQLGMLFSNVTPGRLGYAFGAVAYFRQSEGMDAGHTLGLLSQIQVIELLVKAFASLLGLVFVLHTVGFIPLLTWALLAVVLVSTTCTIFLFVFMKKPRKLPFGILFNNLLADIHRAVSDTKAETRLIIGITAINWFLRGLEWYMIGLAVGVDLSFITFLLLHPLLTITRFTPFTVAGFGVFESTMVVGLGLFGVPASTALLFGLLDRADNGLIDLIALPKITTLLKVKKASLVCDPCEAECEDTRC